MGHNQIGRFTQAAVQAIEACLPPPLRDRQRVQLPMIFHEWERTELQEYLSMPPRRTINARTTQLQAACIKAGELSHAVAALDRPARSFLIQLMTNDARRENFSRSKKRLGTTCEVVASIANLSSNLLSELQSGRAPNLAAYLVLQDAAAIYEWWSGRKPARGVNSNDGRESGPFFRFAAVLWPLIFDNGVRGLPNAMKRWASARNQFKERSALIANLDLRHPAWGLRER